MDAQHTRGLLFPINLLHTHIESVSQALVLNVLQLAGSMCHLLSSYYKIQRDDTAEESTQNMESFF